jgi:hypothetical protein
MRMLPARYGRQQAAAAAGNGLSMMLQTQHAIAVLVTSAVNGCLGCVPLGRGLRGWGEADIQCLN